jgi:hypothetical protein
MKATKTQIRKALDSFLYTHADLTGGTSEEVRRQAPHGLVRLRQLANDCIELASRANKSAQNDSHLMDYCNNLTSKVERYKSTYCPENIISILSEA